MQNNRLSIMETNYFYLIIGLVLLIVGSIVQNREIYSGLVITEYLIVLLPTLLYMKIRGIKVKEALMLNNISIKQALLIPPIVLLSYPIGVFFNYIMIILLSYVTDIKPSPVPIPETGGEFAVGLLIIALSAGICEEIMFRGMVMRAYEKTGVRKAIIISALLFGFFHFNIQNLLGPIFLGVLFGYIVYKTNSIFSAIIAHTTNNAIALTFSFLVSKLGVDTQGTAETAQIMPQTLILLAGGIFIGIIAVTTGVGAFFLLRALPKSEKSLLYLKETNFNEPFVQESPNVLRSFLTWLPLILVSIIFIYLSYGFIKM